MCPLALFEILKVHHLKSHSKSHQYPGHHSCEPLAAGGGDRSGSESRAVPPEEMNGVSTNLARKLWHSWHQPAGLGHCPQLWSVHFRNSCVRTLLPVLTDSPLDKGQHRSVTVPSILCTDCSSYPILVLQKWYLGSLVLNKGWSAQQINSFILSSTWEKL